MEEKFPSCIKEPQREENNLVTIGSRGSWRDKASFNLPLSSPCFYCLKIDDIIDGEIYPVHNWQFIFDIFVNAQRL